MSRAVGACLVAIIAAALPRDGLGLDPGRSLREFRVRRWTASDGLPQSFVAALAQTTDGYIWMGTEEGLARFDGASFTVYDATTTEGLRSGFIMALLAGANGDLWVGTHGGGLSRLSGGTFRAITKAAGLPSNSVWALCPDGEGGVWAGTSSGLARINREGTVTEAVLAGLPAPWVRALHRDGTGVVWIGTRGGGLAKLTSGSPEVVPLGGALATARIRAIATAPDGSIWFGTETGLVHLQAGFARTFGVEAGLSDPWVSAILIDRDGRLWFGTGDGVSTFEDGRLTSYPTRGVTRALLEDHEGNVWAGSEAGGVTRFASAAFTTYTAVEGLSSDLVLSVIEDMDGVVWAGSSARSLNRLVGGRLAHGKVPSPLPDGFPRALAVARNGDLLIGSRGVLRWAGGQARQVRLPAELASEAVLSLLEARDGSLWVGTSAAGIARVLGGVVTRYPSAFPVAAIVEQDDGTLWFGTLGEGLLELRRGKLIKHGTSDGLSSDLIQGLLPDGADLWIGTSGGGLNLLRGGRYCAVRRRHGLFDDTAFVILDDGRGSMWMSSNRGVYRAAKEDIIAVCEGKRESLQSRSFGIADGLRSAEASGINQPAGWRDHRGRLWFAMAEGLAVVDPARLEDNPVAPPVAIEGAVADGRPVEVVDGVTLGPGVRNLEIHYAGLSFVAPEKVRFRYRLEGLDQDWVEAGTRRAAFYTGPSPGHYRFRVVACNNDGIWNETGASWGFAVRPYFFQTRAFAAALVVFACGAAFGLHRLRIRRLRQKNAVLRERNRLAGEIHDHMSQIMTGLLLQLDASREVLDDTNGRVVPYLDRAAQLAREGIDEARRTAWGLRAGALGPGGLADALRRTVLPLVQGTRVAIEVTEVGRRVRMPDDLESELFRVGQEAVTNALRHGLAQHIEVTVSYEEAGVRLDVTDDGCGFRSGTGEPERRAGLGLSGMWRRVGERGGTMGIRSREGGGTIVEVFVPWRRGAG